MKKRAIWLVAVILAVALLFSSTVAQAVDIRPAECPPKYAAAPMLVEETDGQGGWGYIRGTSANYVCVSIAFSAEYIDIPVVKVGSMGARLYSAGAPASPGDFPSNAAVIIETRNITTTGFTLYVFHRDASGSLPTTQYFGFWWEADGEISQTAIGPMQVCGVIRNTGSGWEQIDGAHRSINIASVTNDTEKITVNFTFDADYVNTAAVTPDETMISGQYMVGPSVGTDHMDIYIYQNGTLINPNNYVSATGNIWIFGLFEDNE